MFDFPCLAKGINAWMLHEPEFIGRALVPAIGEAFHCLPSLDVRFFAKVCNNKRLAHATEPALRLRFPLNQQTTHPDAHCSGQPT
jgi:hypothetical protein